MSIIKKYVEYLKDNPEGYWFKRKLYGWGWTPARWQGWVVVAIYIVFLVAFAFTIDEDSPSREVIFTFVLPMILLTVTLISICYKKGERPKWMWGPQTYNVSMKKHYICFGGCKGVSENPGVCQAPDCVNHKHELVECKCTDGLHNGFKDRSKHKIAQ